MAERRVVIAGAGGRDFHNFNTVFRDDPASRVIAFTAAQIPGIDDRRYPPLLAGDRYPDGVPIVPEADLARLITGERADEVVFSYSDVSFQHVMTMASRVVALGADFRLLGARDTMLRSNVPVVSIAAVRTGCGKSQTTRRVAKILREAGKRVVAVRHPMPYGDLTKQRVQRFASENDLVTHRCTIEEREEYEPHIAAGGVVYAGIDYAAILAEAEKEADIILWDGGNNDLPFFLPSLEIVVADPLRVGHERTYHPGAANLFRAHVVIINKAATAGAEAVGALARSVREVNPEATIVEAASPLFVDDPDAVRGKRVLCIEDGPTVTHGEMGYGAAYLAAKRFGAAEIVDPRPSLVGDLKRVFAEWPQLTRVLPAVGYGAEQLADLSATIAKVDCDLILIGTPIDLSRLVSFDRPALRVKYELQEIGYPDLPSILRERGYLS
ncbi:cyclic 2,3-diphosphoglycerate synthase [bacterium]|nr:cyclic 2,3-diphosphoglycerate synthase [bacterium]